MTADDFGSTGDTRLFWLGQAGFMLNVRGIIFMVDPLLVSRPGTPALSETGAELFYPWPLDVEALPRIDAVLYTHTDDDHLGPETAKFLMKHDPVFIGTPCCRDRLEELGVAPVRCLAGLPQAGPPRRGKTATPLIWAAFR